MIIQGSAEWIESRRGCVGASGIADVMAKGKTGGASSTRTNYMMKLLCERLTGVSEEGFTSAAIQRGTELEPLARSAYEVETGNIVEECGFIMHPTIAKAGASPDGLVFHNGLVEIKCPNTSTHVDFIRTGKPAREYQLQMLFQMACTGREWCDFVSFDNRMPEPLQLRMVRFYRDDERIAEIEADVKTFLEELDALVTEMKGLMK